VGLGPFTHPLISDVAILLGSLTEHLSPNLGFPIMEHLGSPQKRPSCDAPRARSLRAPVEELSVLNVSRRPILPLFVIPKRRRGIDRVEIAGRPLSAPHFRAVHTRVAHTPGSDGDPTNRTCHPGFWRCSLAGASGWDCHVRRPGGMGSSGKTEKIRAERDNNPKRAPDDVYSSSSHWGFRVRSARNTPSSGHNNPARDVPSPRPRAVLTKKRVSFRAVSLPKSPGRTRLTPSRLGVCPGPPENKKPPGTGAGRNPHPGILSFEARLVFLRRIWNSRSLSEYSPSIAVSHWYQRNYSNSAQIP